MVRAHSTDLTGSPGPDSLAERRAWLSRRRRRLVVREWAALAVPGAVGIVLSVAAFIALVGR